MALSTLRRHCGFVLVFALLFSAFGHNRASAVAPSRELLDAMYEHESCSGTKLVGDYGRSRGPYHCQWAAWTDACEYGEVDWVYLKNVYNRDRCERVIQWYGELYGATNDDEIARCWNGGSRWRDKPKSTGKYLKRIKTIEARQKAERDVKNKTHVKRTST